MPNQVAPTTIVGNPVPFVPINLPAANQPVQQHINQPQQQSMSIQPPPTHVQLTPTAEQEGGFCTGGRASQPARASAPAAASRGLSYLDPCHGRHPENLLRGARPTTITIDLEAQIGGVTGRFSRDSYICTDFRTGLGQCYVASLRLDLSRTSMNLCVSLSTRYMSFCCSIYAA